MNNLILLGAPNCGKTTTFNGLTGRNERVGNWHGVTTKLAVGTAKIKGKRYNTYDLPGLYSLNAVTLEEETAVNFIKTVSGIILLICECAHLKPALNLLKQVASINKNVILVVNMYKEFVKNGGVLNVKELKKQLGVPVVVGEMNTKKGIKLLKTAIQNFKGQAKNINFNLINVDNFFKSISVKVSRLDRFLLNNVFSIIMLVSVLLLVFYTAFGSYGIGTVCSNFISDLVLTVKDSAQNYLTQAEVNNFIKGLVLDGVIDGAFQIASFLPQTLIFTLALTLLELSGYMARVAFLFEGFLKNTGLNGRAVFSILSGFGCTAVSVFLTGGLENKDIKKKAVFSLTGISCSAKIPALMLISKSVNVLTPFAFMLVVYIFGLCFTLFQLFICDKFIIKSKRTPLVLEIPPLRVPSFNDTLKSLLKCAKQFIIKIGTVVFIISILIYLLKSVSINLTYVNGNYQNSVLYFLGNAFKFLLIPIGINDGRITTALLAGIFAKEGIASVIQSLYSGGLEISLISAISLSVLVYVYSPCITAIGAIKHELGFKFATLIFFITIFESLVFSYFVYALLKWKITLILLLILIILGLSYEKFFSGKRNKTIKVSS
ncbi:MAG: ferrous iron transporter B [Clostridia bacterium]|nr:ferrous iron transporter B [Clostridia bacterium]